MNSTLSQYSNIVVTGTQRSGTTAAGFMFAKSLGYTFYPEEIINQSDVERLSMLLSGGVGRVIQCPALFYKIDQLFYVDTLVVVMRRPIIEIIASQNRIGWDGGPEELARYESLPNFTDEWRWMTHVGQPTPVSPIIRYAFWKIEQEPKMKMPYMEIWLNDLKDHPMWVSPQDRAGFAPRQVTPKHRNVQEES